MAEGQIFSECLFRSQIWFCLSLDSTKNTEKSHVNPFLGKTGISSLSTVDNKETNQTQQLLYFVVFRHLFDNKHRFHNVPGFDKKTGKQQNTACHVCPVLDNKYEL